MINWNRKLRREIHEARKIRRAEKDARPLIDWPALGRFLFTQTRQARVLAGFIAAGAVACFLLYHEDRGPAPPPTYPARGTIEVTGKPPITGGLIEFRPEGGTSLTIAGEINSDGTFSLHTIRGRNRAEGDPEGSYQVSILPHSSGRTARPIMLSRRYSISEGDNDIKVMVAPDQHKK